jgi:processive 1,2-diacylglycerol beta-glucosyltransferase
MPLRKVLILSASAGAGHVRAGQAIERALLETGAAKEVRHVDMLQYTNPLFRNLYSKTYIEMVNRMPELLGWLYDQLDKPWKMERRKLAFDKLNAGPFVKFLKEYQPQITVCTHFLPAEIISWLKAKKQFAARQAIVVTDFDLHAMWLCRHFEQYFVPLEETRVHTEKLGIPRDRIAVTGIPIDPVFAQPKVKLEMRKKYGLQPDLTTILVSAGGFGVGPVENLMTSLRELRHPAQVVAICGRNAELKAKLEALWLARSGSSQVNIHPIGYTDQMDEYMAASDLLLGKPGGLTTSEALARGLVIIVVNPIPGQEERNSDHLLEEGVAIRCNNPPTLAYKIDRLLDDPARLARMRSNVERLARPRAAYDVVLHLLALPSRASRALPRHDFLPIA